MNISLNEQAHGSLTDVSCPASPDVQLDGAGSLEVSARLPPAERHGAQIPAQPAGSSTCLQSHESDLLRHIAQRHAVRLEDFLLAGFAGLLSRLTWQETISVVRQSAVSSLTIFTWHDEISLLAGLVASHDEPFVPGPSLYPGASYLFLQSRETAPDLNGTALRFMVQDESGRLAMTLSSSTGKWSQRTLENWLRSLKYLLLAVAKTPETPLKLLPLIDETEVLGFYKTLNSTNAEYSSGSCAHELIARQVERTPEAVAVIFGDKQLTYRELEDLSNERARHLIGLGAGPNRPVAICMERSEQLPVALLAVLKSGSCYVPFDPQHPRQRIVSILRECRPVAMLSDRTIAPSLKDISIPVLRMDEALPNAQAAETPATSVSPNDLAYIIYTSGTTGKPKGVRIRHRSLVNFLEAIRKITAIKAGERLLALATISFDIATMDMLLPLLSGATVVVASRQAAGFPFELARLIRKHDITLLQATPFTWRLLASFGWKGKPDLRMISGGEALPLDLANRLIPLGRELWNFYGPTEATIWSGALQLQREEKIVPLGPPIANTRFYVLDETGNLLPPGFPGELCIGGAGVSIGYLDQPELTGQHFIRDTFSPEQDGMLFRTGDLVRMVGDHEFEFMGRLDHQVKLRGYRIELGEIESVLRSHAAVENATVILREDASGEPRLVAYVTLRQDNQVPAPELKEYAALALPEYMLPAKIVTLATLPLTVSGKIDRRALPSPESVSDQVINGASAARGIAPAAELENQLLAIFREVLGEASIGVTDNFFDYGGYSLLTARLFSRIHRSLGRRLPISLIFDAPTVRELAELMQKEGALPIIVPIRKEGRAAPLFVIHSYLIYAALCEAIEEERPIYGVRELDEIAPVGNLEERAALYAKEIARTYPDGPLSLAGWCSAGSLTVEVARRLREDGRLVALVALFDSERPGYKPRAADGSSLLVARIGSIVKFHTMRMRDLDWRGKVQYVWERVVHRWNVVLEPLSNRHSGAFHWVREHIPFVLPERIREQEAGLVPEDLRPSVEQFYPGKIVLFRASDAVLPSGAEPSLGWNAVAKGGVEVEFAPGDHESMFREPHLPHFGMALCRAMREGEASCGFARTGS
jgi:amino acid adenylation domain-containing protein